MIADKQQVIVPLAGFGGQEQPPAEPVYDVGATAFRTFFALPGDGWKWHFDVPAFGVRFVALDLNHIQDRGTTW